MLWSAFTRQICQIPNERESVAERVAGIEPASKAWKAPILPLNHTRDRVILTFFGIDFLFLYSNIVISKHERRAKL